MAYQTDYNMNAQHGGGWRHPGQYQYDPLRHHEPIHDQQYNPPYHTIAVSNASIPLKAANVTVEEGTPSNDEKHGGRSFAQKYLGGKKVMLRLYAAITFIIFIFNIGWVVAAVKTYGIQDHYGTLVVGSENYVAARNLGIHALINILSTLVLTSSHSFMQAFTSPSREEIDTAHDQRKWLHIGIFSIRNLRYISWQKRIIVALLIVTTIPLHLLFNATVFTATVGNEYTWAVVTESFLQNAPFVAPDTTGPSLLEMQSQYSTYEYLATDDCVTTYSSLFLTSNSNLLLVTLDTSSDPVVVAGESTGFNESSYAWICSQDVTATQLCNTTAMAQPDTDWTVFGHLIDHCLSQKTPQVDQVRFSLDLAIIVILCNGIKAALMVYALLTERVEDLLTCPGDAIASFVSTPDLTTAGMCLAGERKFHVDWPTQEQPKEYKAPEKTWMEVGSKLRQGLMTGGLFLFVCLLAGLYVFAFIHLEKQGKNPQLNFAFGFSHETDALLFGHSLGSASTVALLANLPQLLLAPIMVGVTGMLTTIYLARDWVTYTGPQYLMSSSPSGPQRKTWLLNMPLKMGSFILIVSAALHWSVSQSIFPVEGVTRTLSGAVDRSAHLSNLGFSLSGVLTTGALLFLLLFTLAIVVVPGKAKYRKWTEEAKREAGVLFLEGAPPIVGTCSAAISASCHLPVDMRTDGMLVEMWRWGALMGSNQRRRDGVGHATIAPDRAWAEGRMHSPQEGAWYAGI